MRRGRRLARRHQTAPRPRPAGVAVDVLVVGAGPSGSAAAYWLASAGHDVMIVEKDVLPRDKTCGDMVTPRGIRQLADMGITDVAERFHRINGVRMHGEANVVEVAWPAHPDMPDHGVTARRDQLDELVARRAVDAGASLLVGHEAVQPIVERGFVRGAVVQTADGETRNLRATYVIVADGANSRFGRALGTFRTREWPYALAIRGRWSSSQSSSSWLDVRLGLTDRGAKSMPGYGWVAPLGDGSVNVGVGVLSTFREFKGVNTTHLLEHHVHQLADRAGIDPTSPIDRPASARVPMGSSVGPSAGPSYLVVGDAAGMVSPFNGDGISYAYESGRMAAAVIGEALTNRNAALLQRYPKLIDERYGSYFQVARLFARAIGRPAVMRQLTRAGLRSQRAMELVVRIQSNMLRDSDLGAAEALFATASVLGRLAPNA